MNEHLAIHDFRPPPYVMLLTLQESGAMSQAELGARTALDRSDVTEGVRLLVARGCVRQSVDPHDRRRNVVSLTPAGDRMATDLLAEVDAAQAEFMAPLDADQREQLRGLLTVLLDYHVSRE
ncbi:MarR family winged helix-turn-helix transcriptional regulator [Ruania alba]|uniref:MarR family winged helix-turn-helix transcriptional regulator n=1 Tax=Ruania alba TaxID=648782 RepID=UPI000B7E2D57|nr:MarR family winged helix-turn-helix transcriptional regulator [Ruania alba]